MKPKSDELTPDEQAAIKALIAVLKDFPPSLCLTIEDMRLSDTREPNIQIYKRTSKHACTQVFAIRKRSVSM